MHHICTICQSPFLLDSDSATPDTETVVTTCGHIFHRDCIELRAKAEGSSCGLCDASLREGNKFTKIFLFYNEDEDDVQLLKDVQRATAPEKLALEEQSHLVRIEKDEDLREESIFNQRHIRQLNRTAKVLDSHVEGYERRLTRLQSRINEMKAHCKELEGKL